MTSRIAPAPLLVRKIRVLLSSSSRTAPMGATDPRDRQGFAVRLYRTGTYTLDFNVNNGFGPTGLRVAFTEKIMTPEPGTMMLGARVFFPPSLPRCCTNALQ